MNISFSSKSDHLSWTHPKTDLDMTLSCSYNCLITRSNQKHVTPHNVLGNPRPFLMESNLKLSMIPRLHWKIPDALPELTKQLIYRIEIRAYLTFAVCFGFCTQLSAFSERDIPVIGRSELIRTRTREKTNCLKLVIFKNDPLSIHWRTAWTGLSKTVTLFNNLMHN